MTSRAGDDDHALAGRVVAVPETRQLDVLAGLLERRGASVLRCPLVGIEDSPDEPAVRAWLERAIAGRHDLFVFYTGEGIERLCGFARRAGLERAFLATLERVPKLTRGPKPQRALRRLGLSAELEAADPTTDGLIATVAAFEAPLRRVGVQLYGSDQDRRLLEHFAGRGIDTDCVLPYVYASASDDDRVAALVADLGAGRIDAIAFTSKAQVTRLFRVAREHKLRAQLEQGLRRTCVAAVGPIVRAELEADGVRVDVTPSEQFSMKPLVTALCGALGARR
jgi:uroporphyrinogen-III synthase